MTWLNIRRCSFFHSFPYHCNVYCVFDSILNFYFTCLQITEWRGAKKWQQGAQYVIFHYILIAINCKIANSLNHIHGYRESPHNLLKTVGMTTIHGSLSAMVTTINPTSNSANPGSAAFYFNEHINRNSSSSWSWVLKQLPRFKVGVWLSVE